jgi:hypothetical protein
MYLKKVNAGDDFMDGIMNPLKNRKKLELKQKEEKQKACFSTGRRNTPTPIGGAFHQRDIKFENSLKKGEIVIGSKDISEKKFLPSPALRQDFMKASQESIFEVSEGLQHRNSMMS